MSAKSIVMAAAGATAPTYVDDVFSTYLYTGNGSAQTINNGIDLAGKGGMVWIKSRSAIENNRLFDTLRGVNNSICTNLASSTYTSAELLTAFNSNGFSVGSLSTVNTNAATYSSWTFREAPKFFDVVTYTGTGVARTVAHNLGSTPGMVLVRGTTSGTNFLNWAVWHNSLASSAYAMAINQTLNSVSQPSIWNSTAPTSTEFTVGTDSSVNANGQSYVAYLFAHDTAVDGLIQCGSFTTNASGNATVSLGWEPQFLLLKKTGLSSWNIFDNMRGQGVSTGNALYASGSNVEGSPGGEWAVSVNATGFSVAPGTAAAETSIYLAIRRSNKPPTTGTQVFSANAVNVSTGTAITTNFPVDLQIFSLRSGTTNKNNVYDRLRGISSNTTESGVRLITSSTVAETAAGNETLGWDNAGFKMTSVFSGTSNIFWNFRRATGFFDVVCYTGTGVNGTVNHNLGVTPELMIVKSRGSTSNWPVYHSAIGPAESVFLTLASAKGASSTTWNDTSPTASVFSVGVSVQVNGSSGLFVAYLFATLPGISKVFSYTGNGSSQTINCGFSNGARFVLIKRTDSTGDWYVWDTALGIIAANDPHLSLNNTAAEVTTDDSIDPDNTGFIVNQVAATNINVTSATYIGLAIA